jgi:desulfoferrodoxin (superoxide reductase-like protein)
MVLPALEAEPEDDYHHLHFEQVEDEYYVTIPHEMSKTHYISFIVALKDAGCEIRKLYPEGNAEARFKISRTKSIMYYCNQHGLFKASVQ